jgi:hypothetical protein
MWRVGFPTPKNEDDNALYCGGFGVQHDHNGGKCGICGDPWDAFPREHEAPHGRFATGIIAKTYRQGSVIPVVLDLTANHQGWFTFKICPNNDIWEDPEQSCFDLFPLPVGKDRASRHPVTDYRTGLRLVYVHLPRRLSCSQCILQWTYTAGNNWGVCTNGTGELGCGPQETFRACSDIRILPSGKRKPSPSTIASFSDDTTFDLNQFEDYYDELFGGQNDNINAIDGPDREEDFETAAVMSIQTKKLKLIHKKLVLAKALKSLRHLITQSHEKEKEREREEERRSPSSMFSPAPTYTTYTPYTPQPLPYTPQSSTYTPLLSNSKPLHFSSSALATSSFLDQLDMDRQTSTNLWSGSNSHGKRRKKRRRRRFSDLIYTLFA